MTGTRLCLSLAGLSFPASAGFASPAVIHSTASPEVQFEIFMQGICYIFRWLTFFHGPLKLIALAIRKRYQIGVNCIGYQIGF